MMNTSLDTEHLKPRVSEQLRSKGIPAAPRGGIHSRSAGGYGSATLEGNWYEDRYDSRFADKQTVLPTALDQSWRTTYHAQVGRRGWNGGAAHDSGNASCSLLAAPLPPLGHLPPLDPSTQLTRPTLGLLATLDAAAGDAPSAHLLGTSTRSPATGESLRKSLGSRHAVSQSELVEIAAGRHRAFPGHQPERDLPPKQSDLDPLDVNGKPLLMTEQRRSYGDPEARHRKSQTNAVDLFAGAPSDKPAFAIFKINVGLKQRGGGPAFGATFGGSASSSDLLASGASGTQMSGSARWRPPPAVKRGGRNASALPVLSEASSLHLTALKAGVVVDRSADAAAAAAQQHAAVATNYSFAALRRSLKGAEARPLVAGGTKSRDGMVNLAEVQAGFAAYGLDNVTAEDATVLFKHFDPTGTGEVDLVKLVAGIRGAMNERRRSVVQQAFALVERTVLRVHGDSAMSTKTPGQSMVEFNVFRSSMSPTFGKAGSGSAGVVVLMSNLVELFDADSHPDVRSGAASPDDVRRQLFDDYYATLEAAGPGSAKARRAADEVITLERFTELYEDWSALVVADHHFEAAVRGCWHLTGGIGVARCVSNLQVEVVHTNGRITTQVIRDDLAISADDFDLMKLRLAEQGIKDVKKLRVL